MRGGDGKLAEDHVVVEWNHPSGSKPKDKLLVSPLASKEQMLPAMTSNSRTVVSPDGWKLSLYDQDKHQLYNLAKDPYETTNLFGRDDCRDVTKRLTSRLAKWQAETKDTVDVV